MIGFIQKTYEKSVLDHPRASLFLIFAIVAFFGVYAQQFRLDASSETLSLENDQALKYYRSIKDSYGSDEYLVITYTPQNELFSPTTLAHLKVIRDDLAQLENIESVISILDVPLINSPPVTIDELSRKIPKLLNPNTNRTLARQELMTSPLYSDLLISQDGKTTALLVNFREDKRLQELILRRDVFKEKGQNLDFIQQEYKAQNKHAQQKQRKDISAIRAILKEHSSQAKLYLGGVPMIVSDSIDYIERDLRVFGVFIMGFLILLLTLIFKSMRWVLLPMITCFCVGLSMIGFLGFVNWPVTIVSANFISLLLIFTLSFCVHQIVRYNEFLAENPEADQRTLVRNTVFDISVPCFYMAFTTAVGFGSLVVSGIRPVIDFGWMMAIGIIFSFTIAFILFPAALMFLKPLKSKKHFDLTWKITSLFSHVIQKHGRVILFLFSIFLVVSIWGMNSLYVQNRFIDYYKEDTAIYQGMKMIDSQLGGTTPLDIIIDAPQSFIDHQKEEKEFLTESDFYIEDNNPAIIEGYRFSEALLKDVATIHDYLKGLPETGKVLSFHTTAQLLQDLDEKKLLDRMYLGVLYKKLPDSVKDILFSPYISDDGNQLRFSVRVFESQGGLDRQTLIEKIRLHLTTELELKENQVHLTGMVVLYNNVLQTLFRSQILTIGVVFITMLLIFWALFRNFKIAMVAIIPNITIVAMVLGIMGWLGIPLDIMTITIAAICFGMADDDTIHYVHRFMREFKKSGNYWKAIKQSHNTIGRAMYYTTITIMLGFSILAFSNFVPTIYFGLLTGFSMLIALLCDLMLLPLLIILFKPMGQEKI